MNILCFVQYNNDTLQKTSLSANKEIISFIRNEKSPFSRWRRKQQGYANKEITQYCELYYSKPNPQQYHREAQWTFVKLSHCNDFTASSKA
jgi:hypothetical protein